ncbi:Gfo/Idh/MocA family protein [Streptomyces purpureus]|uniref:Gfo/Idh/MocA family protein n=1 Tax=Streptomyces purpureus TaxID=1951 RepID=UPI0003634822|nr:Gfo/Idh/MocA family oxidoreductase [Streptomyces purpureus]
MSGAPLGVVRVAVVGLGWAAKSIWLPRLREHPGFAVSALVDPDRAALAAAVHDRTGTLLLTDVDELTPDVADLAVVAVPNHLHAAIACRLLVNGVPVFLEKPVCLNSEEAEQLAAAETGGGSLLLAGSAARYRADVLALRELVANLGHIRHVDLSWVRARGIPDAGGWFTQRQYAGGGALVDLGWHLLDTVTPLLGDVRGDITFDQALGTVSDDFVRSSVARASWREEQSLHAYDDDSAGDVEDTARGFLVTDTGVSVGLRASWASHEPRDVTVIRVDGSEGTATLRCTFGFSPNRVESAELTLTKDGVVTQVPFPVEPIGAEYMRQLDELPALLAAPESRGRAVRETRRTIAVIERIYETARAARATRTARAAAGRRATAAPGPLASAPAAPAAAATSDEPAVAVRIASPVRVDGADVSTNGRAIPAPTHR